MDASVIREAGDVTPGSGKALNETVADRIGGAGENDRDRFGFRKQYGGSRCTAAKQYVISAAGKIVRRSACVRLTSLRPRRTSRVRFAPSAKPSSFRPARTASNVGRVVAGMLPSGLPLKLR